MWTIMLALLSACAVPAPDEARRDPEGFLVHELRSEYQPGATTVRVLPPSRREPGETFPVVYVLPVEAGDESRFGDGLGEVRRLGLHDRHRAIFVAPRFAQLPWYADHPSDRQIRQESHFLKAVVPLVERTYPARREPGDRHLLGFSKSGWGAFSLLLRHPAQFGRAAAWDAPLMMDAPGRYGSGPIFGTAENFERYRLTRLVEEQGPRLGASPRLIHLGRGNFHEEHEAFEQLLTARGVPHRYVRGPARRHHWAGGWLPDAVEALLPAGAGQAR